MDTKKLEIFEKLIAGSHDSKITHWEIRNFAQHEYSVFRFDEDGVVILKGFNSNGKSNALKALRACLTTDWVASGKIRKMVRHGETEATVRVFFDDGVEIEYNMFLSSLAPKARFSNSYFVYLHKNGKRIELFNTLKDGKAITVKETPPLIKRYVNFAEMGGRYLNVMRKGEGVLILDQSPRALMKSMAKAIDLETPERAIDRINKDNKETYSNLRSLDTQIEMYSDEIKARRHLTDEVMEQLANLSDAYNRSMSAYDSLSGVAGVFRSMSGVSTPIAVDSVDDSKLDLMSKSVKIFEILSETPTLPVIEGVKTESTLTLLQRSVSVLNQLSDVEYLNVQVAEIPTSTLTTFAKTSKLLSDLVKASNTVTPKVSEVDVLALSTVSNVSALLETYETHVGLLSEIEEKRAGYLGKMQETLAELEQLGHPVAKCSVCGELSLMERVDGVNGLVEGSTGHSHTGVSEAGVKLESVEIVDEDGDLEFDFS